jgi:hypothetical protein
MAEEVVPAAPETQQPPVEGEAAAPEVKPEERTFSQAEVDEIVHKVKDSQRSKAYRREQKLRREIESASLEVARFEPQAETPQRKEDESYEDWIRREAAYIASHEARKVLEEHTQHVRAKTQEQAQAELSAQWEKAKDSGRKKYPDFEDVTGRPDVMISVAMGRSIQESEVGHEIAYYLGKHPEEAESIAEQSISGQIRAIGRLEAKLQESKAPTKQPAAPINPIETRGKDGSSTELSRNLDQDEWNRRWDMRMAQRARERSGR